MPRLARACKVGLHLTTKPCSDPDVHTLLKNAVQRSGSPFKQMLNDALHVGQRIAAEQTPLFRQPVCSLRLPEVGLIKAGGNCSQYRLVCRRRRQTSQTSTLRHSPSSTPLNSACGNRADGVRPLGAAKSNLCNASAMPTKVKELLAQLQADGWHLVRQKGNHRQYHHASKPGTVTVAGKERVEIPPGTLNSILKQASLKK